MGETVIDPVPVQGSPKGKIANAFASEFASLINRHSLERSSNTPDFILAEIATIAIDQFAEALMQDEKEPAVYFGQIMETAFRGAIEVRKRWYRS